jgi:hypothetical protein
VALLDLGPLTVEVSEGLVILESLGRRAGSRAGELLIVEDIV